MWLTVFHLLTTVHHIYAVTYLLTVNYGEISHPYLIVMRDMGLRYLTIWNLILQCVYFGSCISEIVLGDRNPLVQHWKKLREPMFRALVFPVAVMVATLFWALFTLDRSLVYPHIVDQYVEPYVNHMMHTTVVVVAALEMVLRPHRYRRRGTDITILLLFCCCYLACFTHTHRAHGVWVYPLYEHLSWTQQQLMNFMLTFITPVAIYLLGETTATKLHGTSIQQLNGADKKIR